MPDSLRTLSVVAVLLLSGGCGRDDSPTSSGGDGSSGGGESSSSSGGSSASSSSGGSSASSSSGSGASSSTGSSSSGASSSGSSGASGWRCLEGSASCDCYDRPTNGYTQTTCRSYSCCLTQTYPDGLKQCFCSNDAACKGNGSTTRVPSCPP